MIRFACPFCHFKIEVPTHNAGGRISCPSCGTSVAVPASGFETGCIIGDFLILGRIGSGANGMVYLAQQISLERQVALKLLPVAKNEAVGGSTFLNEARAAARLSHTNLVQAYAVGEVDGYSYMAMNYIRGETLKARLKREKRIPVDEALHIIQQIAEALYYAWEEAKLIHRDVKPDNIILADDGTAKLTDLGLAMSQSDWREDMDISGSPSYMSPEQFLRRPLDTRSDIYSLGITLYQMITGLLPFRATDINVLARQHVNEKPEPPENFIHGLKSQVSALIRKMIAKKPDKRYTDMEELLYAIWHIRQLTAPKRDYIPDVHTISIRRLNYTIQREAAAATHRKERASRREIARKNAIYMRVLFLVIPVVVIFMIAVFLIFDKARIHNTNNNLNIYDGFEKMAANPDIPYEKLQEEADKLLLQLDSTELPNNRYKPYIVSHIRYLLQKRNSVQPISKTVIDSAKQNSIANLENDIKVLSAENAMLKTQVIPNLHLINQTYQEQNEQLRKTIAESDAERKKEHAKLELQLHDAEKFHNAVLETAKNNIRLRTYQLLITQRFSGAKQLLKSESTTYPELNQWSTDLLEQVNLLEKVYSSLKNIIESVGTFEYFSPALIVTSYRADYPDSKASSDDIIGAFELMRGNLKNAAKYLPNQPEINATADAVAEDLLVASRTLHSTGVKNIPTGFRNTLNSLPKTPRVIRVTQDIRQIFGSSVD